MAGEKVRSIEGYKKREQIDTSFYESLFNSEEYRRRREEKLRLRRYKAVTREIVKDALIVIGTAVIVVLLSMVV